MTEVRVGINRKNIKASVTLPASKSISNRLLTIRHLCGHDFHIENLSDSDDTKTLNQCLQNINAQRVFSVNDAGTPLRFLTAVFAMTQGNRLLTGTPRLLLRPVGPLVDALNLLGARIYYFDKRGYPPLVIEGSEIRGGKVVVDAGISSQFVSALLLIAPLMPDGLEITLKKPVASAPYIPMTLGLMKECGVASEWNDDIITINPQQYAAGDFIVEADWSAAAFWYEIAALSDEAEIVLQGLWQPSLQGDAVVAEIFSRLGVATTYLPDAVKLTKTKEITSMLEQDFFEFPDLFPAVMATCAALNVPCRFTGLENLQLKESDRIKTMIEELGKFGYFFKIADQMTLIPERYTGTEITRDVEVSTHSDHRLAMALAPLALKGAAINLDNALCVAKSYPGYFEDLKCAGFTIGFPEK